MKRIVKVEIEEGPDLLCVAPPELAVHVGDQVLIDAGGEQEFGRAVMLVDRDEQDASGKKMPRLLRCATLQDIAKARENALRSKMALETLLKKAAELKLEIRIVRGHYIFDRSLLRVEFIADGKVDVKELARQTGAELRCRCDLRQIGVRDAAGIIGGIGPCGRTLCCCSWLNKFESVNVKMAKNQGLSLNPAAISGSCGRLKCCLRYENDYYKQVAAEMPRMGSRQETPEGRGVVVGLDMLRYKVSVRLEDGRIITCKAEKKSNQGGHANEGSKCGQHAESACGKRAQH